jgi:hypothetical protein
MDTIISKQTVRLIDVFAIAPFLIYASYTVKAKPFIKTGLFVIGVATALYNGVNYVKELK